MRNDLIALAVVAVVGLVLLFMLARSPTGAVVRAQCESHSDCSGSQYCGQIGPVPRCLPRLTAQVRCYEDANCRSNRCSTEGYCY